MTQAVRNFFRDEERASRKLLEGAVLVMVTSFAVAVAAIFWLR